MVAMFAPPMDGKNPSNKRASFRPMWRPKTGPNDRFTGKFGMRHSALQAIDAGRPHMQRLTITIDDDLVAEVDDFIEKRGYANRSEAFRDLLRSGLEHTGGDASPNRHCIATLSYVYDHAARELPKRLTNDYHEHHDLAQATLHRRARRASRPCRDDADRAACRAWPCPSARREKSSKVMPRHARKR
jgi:nickel-responsive transcriptional regulator NikR